MKLYQTLSNRSLSLLKKNEEYKKHVLTVNELMIALLNSKLPSMLVTPPNYGEFAMHLVRAKNESLSWVNNVLTPLLENPKTITNRQKSISYIFEDAITHAKSLVQDPSTSFSRDILLDDLNTLKQQFYLITIILESTVESIKKFKSHIPECAQDLMKIVELSKAASGVDKEKIDQFNKEIEQLNADIKSLTAAIAGLAIADGIAITLGLVVTIAGWPLGAVSWLVLAPAVAIATTYIVLDKQQIIADKEAIKKKESEVSDLESSIIVLNILANEFDATSKKVKELEVHLQAILAEWQLLEDDMNKSLESIIAGIKDTAEYNYQNVLEDLEKSQTEWNDVYRQSGLLSIDININEAPLEIGMDENQTKSILEKNPTISIIEYYNRKAI